MIMTTKTSGQEDKQAPGEDPGEAEEAAGGDAEWGVWWGPPPLSCAASSGDQGEETTTQRLSPTRYGNRAQLLYISFN